MLHNENGLTSNIYRCYANTAQDACRASKVNVFRDSNKFMEEHSAFLNFVLENFRSIFLDFSVVCTLMLIAFGVHHLVKFVKRRSILVRSRLEGSLRDLTAFVSGFFTGLAHCLVRFIKNAAAFCSTGYSCKLPRGK